jgi:serine/threonine protein kinase
MALCGRFDNAPTTTLSCVQAPECLDGGKALPASDVYSYGLILFELLTWQLPWGSASSFAVRFRCADQHMPFAQRQLFMV